MTVSILVEKKLLQRFDGGKLNADFCLVAHGDELADIKIIGKAVAFQSRII